MEKLMGVVGGAKSFFAGGAKTVGAKSLVLISSPVFGVVALAGVIGWQLWKAKKDEKEMNAQKATA